MPWKGVEMIRTILAFCLCAAFSMQALAADPFADAQTAREYKDYGHVLALLQPLAEKGDARAQYAVGFLYESGLGVAQDAAAALKWYLKAAEQGLPEAENAAGYFYGAGLGCAEDAAVSEAWLAKSTAAGQKENPLRMHVSGVNVRIIYPDDLAWFSLAAKQGFPAAQSQLGKMYKDGMGVPQEYETGYKWLRKAAAQGDAPAQYELGSYYYRTENSPVKEWDEAESLLRKSAEKGYVPAELELARVYDQQEFPISEAGTGRDGNTAITWYLKAAEQGSLQAKCRMLAEFLPAPTGGCGFDGPPQKAKPLTLTPEQSAARDKFKADIGKCPPVVLQCD